MNALDILFGTAVGDALGVPVEFKSRDYLKQHPVTGMTGYGTWNQPPGTWSDDSSLTFCLAEAIAEGYSLENSARRFIRWFREGYWGAHHKVFDVGMATQQAILRLEIIFDSGNLQELKNLKGGGDENENGNGSLMRIMPLLWVIAGKDIQKQFEMIWENSALTHRHIRAAICCFIYLKIAEELMFGKNPKEAYKEASVATLTLWKEMHFPDNEKKHFERIINRNISDLPVEQIKSGGYVIESLEASIWCLLNTSDYRSAVLTAVNLGDDTDTTAAITGGLAGLYYGKDAIPSQWIEKLARKYDIMHLADKLDNLNK
jgi:ADP-ribosyl-[dinitrogen reductase] hydrolase